MLLKHTQLFRQQLQFSLLSLLMMLVLKLNRLLLFSLRLRFHVLLRVLGLLQLDGRFLNQPLMLTLQLKLNRLLLFRRQLQFSLLSLPMMLFKLLLMRLHLKKAIISLSRWNKNEFIFLTQTASAGSIMRHMSLQLI